MNITYLGHSAFQIKTSSHTLLIDPFITGNDLCPVKPEDLKCDFILLTHGHPDHVGDTVEIAKANNATVVATFELAHYIEAHGIQVRHMGIGGSAQFPFGKVKFTLAHHSSSLPGKESGSSLYMGNPAGIIIEANGHTLYHAGDTALFLDMKLIGEMHSIDIAMLPIGDNFTMGIDDAVKATEFLHPKAVIPVHYNTFEVIQADPQEFAQKAQKLGPKVHVMEPGTSLELN